jgi:hypothetical protein
MSKRKEWFSFQWIGIMCQWQVLTQTVVSMSYHNTNPTKFVGLVQSWHHLIEMYLILISPWYNWQIALKDQTLAYNSLNLSISWWLLFVSLEKYKIYLKLLLKIFHRHNIWFQGKQISSAYFELITTCAISAYHH